MKRYRVRSVVIAATLAATTAAVLLGTAAGTGNAQITIIDTVPNNYERTCDAAPAPAGVGCTGYQLVNSPNPDGSPDPCVLSVYYTTTRTGGYHKDWTEPAKKSC